MPTISDVLQVLDNALTLDGRALTFTADTPLLGALPELDSMAVVALINALEDQFGVVMADDEISGETFSTVGSLTQFVNTKVEG